MYRQLRASHTHDKKQQQWQWDQGKQNSLQWRQAPFHLGHGMFASLPEKLSSDSCWSHLKQPLEWILQHALFYVLETLRDL